MTDKHIPASKLLALPTYQQDWRGDIEPSRGDNVPNWIKWADLDNLIDAEPESVEPVVDCSMCPNNRDVVCAYCEGSGETECTDGHKYACTQGCTQGCTKNDLLSAAKEFYNATLADKDVKISCKTAEARDKVFSLGEKLKEAIIAAPQDNLIAEKQAEIERVTEQRDRLLSHIKMTTI